MDTDIWLACKEGNLDIVRIMIREGQNENEKTHTMGNTPLHIASRNGHYLIVKYLLEQGADTQLTNVNGLTPKQFLQEVLISDPVKLEKVCSKMENQAAANKLRAKQKLQADTMRLLTDNEKHLRR